MKTTLKSYFQSHTYPLVALAASLLAVFAGWLPADTLGLGSLFLLNTDGGDGAAAAGAGGASPAPTSTPAAPAAGEPTPAAAAPETKPESTLPRSKGAAAADRAADRLAKASAAKQKSAVAASAQQPTPGETPAAGTEGKPVEGQQAAPPGESEPGKEKPTAGDTPPAEPAKAPENWTADRQAKFNALPSEARVLVNEFHKEMSAGVTHVLTQLSEERTRHQDLFALNDRFSSGAEGAKEVLASLAKQANIELYFDKPEADEAIPEDVLADPRKLSRYIEDRAVARAAKATAAATEKTVNEGRLRAAQETLVREFQDTAKAHPDFATHRPAVNALLQKAPSLSVEEAYRVVTHDALVKLANEAPALKHKLAAAEAELATFKKKATTLPAGGDTGKQKGDDKFLTPAQRAFANAEAKRSTRGVQA